MFIECIPWLASFGFSTGSKTKFWEITVEKYVY